jgi:hypothetical protein
MIYSYISELKLIMCILGLNQAKKNRYEPVFFWKRECLEYISFRLPLASGEKMIQFFGSLGTDVDGTNWRNSGMAVPFSNSCIAVGHEGHGVQPEDNYGEFNERQPGQGSGKASAGTGT